MAEKSSRRRFLKGSLLVVPAAALPAGIARQQESVPAPQADATPEVVLPAAVLHALADTVLPRTELGAKGVADATDGFARWVAGIRPVAELDHPYLADEIEYGPPDPRPMWRAQLLGLGLLAKQRHGGEFEAQEPGVREELVRRQLESFKRTLPEGGGLPHARDAQHVAIALLAWYYATPGATDLCYRAAIARYDCRGIDDAGREPAPLAATASALGDPRVGS